MKSGPRVVLRQLFDDFHPEALGRFLPLHPGVDFLPLYGFDPEGRARGAEQPSAALVRYVQGAAVPHHQHPGYEHIMVLSGSQTDAEGHYPRGTCIMNPPGTRHAVTSEEGCLVLAIWNQPVALTDNSQPRRTDRRYRMRTTTLQCLPSPITMDLTRTAAVIIDMQRDFLEPGGFGESLGNDVSQLRRAIEPCKNLLFALRQQGVFIVHTREGHRPDLSDAPQAKLERGSPRKRIGDPGPMGRILIRGEAGHDIIPELSPEPGEPIIDKPGKGAFYATDLGAVLQGRGIDTLLVCGVTTEVCVHTTVREANDRGYRAVVLSDCTASYFPEFHEVGLRMVAAQGGIFGWVSDSSNVLSALE